MCNVCGCNDGNVRLENFHHDHQDHEPGHLHTHNNLHHHHDHGDDLHHGVYIDDIFLLCRSNPVLGYQINSRYRGVEIYGAALVYSSHLLWV